MSRHLLELVEVDGFAQDGHGWGLGWTEWHANARRDRRAVEFSFFEDDEEVARARVYPKSFLDAPYEGLGAGPFVEIDLVVVRQDMRGNFRGPEVVALLVSHYHGRELMAFSAADHLWVNAGWSRVSRLDRDEFAAPLFVHSGQ